ncbi:MAG: sensor histidine kinase [Gammaproteobacteria bacterium]|nr:sensor histidine kinase [Gammaproteobacteria bacterium]
MPILSSSRLRLKLQTRLMLAFAFVVLIQAAITGGITHSYIQVILENRIGEQALQLSKVVSHLPQIRQGLQQRDVNQIQPLAELLRKQTDARFIVVGDENNIRFSHPIPERIGKKRVGGDNQRALESGESYISKAVGSLGPSIRGKSPVFDNEGNVIGVTSVGYMLDRVDQTIQGYQQSALLVVLISLIISIITGIIVTRYFKRVLFGLEPEEIASLYEERNTTLETIREGVISIDAEGLITTFNKTALETLGIKDNKLTGRSIRDVFPQSDLWKVLETGDVELDREIIINDQHLIVNRLPIKLDNKVTGVVSSFRPKGEIELLSRKLSHIEQYAETLRSQSHDYANKLHTIAGLIQINANDQALELIGQESRGLQELVHLLVEAIPDPVLAGCILGKYNRAHELGLELVVDSSSHLTNIPPHMTSEKLMSLMGNIVDNAFEATRQNLLKQTSGSNQVLISISDYGNDLIFEIEDHGAGIPEEDKNRIFDKGISSKVDQGHGYGLYLVKSILLEFNGHIDLENTESGGIRFIVYLPKKLK